MQTLLVVLSVFVPNLVIMIFIYQISNKLILVNQKAKNFFWAGTSLSFLNIIMFLIGNAHLDLLLSFVIFISLVILILPKQSRKTLSFSKYTAHWIVMSINIIFIYFYSAFSALSPIHVDTYSNYIWIKRNLEQGLTNYVYFPGITNITNLSIKMVEPLENLNFFAVTLNLILLLSVNLVLKSILKVESLIIFNIILISIALYPILDVRISLLSINFVYYIFICIIVVFITRSTELNRCSVQMLLILLMFSAALFSPHLTALLAPSMVLVLIVLRKSISIRTFLQITMGLLLSIWLGMNYNLKQLSGVGYVQNLDRFNNLDTSLTYDSSTFGNAVFALIRNYFSFKQSIYLSGVNSLSIGAILVYILTIICYVYAVRSNSLKLKILLSINLILGFTTLTGIGDLNFIKGRVAIFYMLNTALIVALVFDQLINKKGVEIRKIQLRFFVMALLISNFALNLTFLPQMSNKVDESVFKAFYKLVKDESKQKIYVYSNQPYLGVLSRRIEQIEKIEKADYVVLNLSNESNLYKMRYYNQEKLENIQLANENKVKMDIEQMQYINNLFYDYSSREDYKIEVFSRNKFVIFSK